MPKLISPEQRTDEQLRDRSRARTWSVLYLVFALPMLAVSMLTTLANVPIGTLQEWILDGVLILKLLAVLGMVVCAVVSLVFASDKRARYRDAVRLLWIPAIIMGAAIAIQLLWVWAYDFW